MEFPLLVLAFVGLTYALCHMTILVKRAVISGGDSADVSATGETSGQPAHRS